MRSACLHDCGGVGDGRIQEAGMRFILHAEKGNKSTRRGQSKVICLLKGKDAIPVT